MKPAPFHYHAPTTVEETVSLLVELGEEAKLIAGGQSLAPMLALRLAVFDHLVDLRKVAGLTGIERRDGRDGRDGAVWVGAGTTQARIEHSAEIAETVPLLARATPFIGHFQIRNRGTIGGSLAHADAAAEYPAVALTLDADLDVASPRGPRTVPAALFFTGLWSTALDVDEVLTGIRFPVWDGRCGFAVEEFARRHGDFAIAGTTVAVEIDPNDRVKRCAIGLFGLGPAPRRAWTVEAEVIGQRRTEVVAEEIGQAAVSELDSVPADSHGSADYRRRVGAAMVARAWQRASLEAAHD